MSIEEECHEILNKADVAVGDEHRTYSLQDRIKWLIVTKEYAWRRYDEIQKSAMSVTTPATLEHLAAKLNG